MSNNKIPLSEISKRFPIKNKSSERSTWGRILLFPLRFLGSILGIDKETISSYNKSSSHQVNVPHHSHVGHSPATFREQNHFDPEKWVIKEMQAEAYHDLVDGKGDCDHDHEH